MLMTLPAPVKPAVVDLSDYPEGLTMEEAAELLRISTTTMDRLARRRELPFVFRIGHDWRCLRNAFALWVSAQVAGPATGELGLAAAEPAADL